MIIKWQEHIGTAPTTLQMIEKASGFIYSPAYGTLVKDGKAIRSEDLYEVFDKFGWFAQVYYMGEFWNGVICDSLGNMLYNDPASFIAADVRGRKHAESFILGILIDHYEQAIKQMIKWDSIKVLEHADAVVDSSRVVAVDQLKPSDLNHKALEEMAVSEVFGIADGKMVKIIKSNKTFPWVDMVLVRE